MWVWFPEPKLEGVSSSHTGRESILASPAPIEPTRRENGNTAGDLKDFQTNCFSYAAQFKSIAVS